MRHLIVVLVITMLAGLVRGQAPASAPTTTRADLVDPLTPAQKLTKDGTPAARFMQMHQEFIERGKQPADVLFIGDSITEAWRGAGKTVWEENYSKYNAANFGISGDRTQHVLWRLQNGELEDIKPKVTVIMIGTNNLSSDPQEKIAQAVEKIVKLVREKTGSKILLLGIFPRGQHPDDPKTKMFRDKIAFINGELKKLEDGKDIRFLDIGSAFLEPDGSISKQVMRDFLHPTAEGYERWAKAMNPTLDEMLK